MFISRVGIITLSFALGRAWGLFVFCAGFRWKYDKRKKKGNMSAQLKKGK
jgi:hypothetical protein